VNAHDTARPLIDQKAPTMTATATLPKTAAANRVNLPRSIRAEFVKFFTLTSNRVLVAVATLFIPASATMLALSFANPNSTGNRAPGTDLTKIEPIAFVDSVLWIQLLFAVVIALFVTSEYTSGQIKLSFLAVPGRTRMLLAKVFLAAVIGFGIAFLGTLAAQTIPALILSGTEVDYSITTEGVLLLASKAGLYLAAIGILATGIAFLVRNVVVAILIPVLLLSIFPEMIRSIPVDPIRDAVEFFPSIAGRLLISTIESGAGLTDWQGYLVLGGWAIGVLVVSGIVLKTRDA
jgi:ABC-2 type transport system permease protein